MTKHIRSSSYGGPPLDSICIKRRSIYWQGHCIFLEGSSRSENTIQLYNMNYLTPFPASLYIIFSSLLQASIRKSNGSIFFRFLQVAGYDVTGSVSGLKGEGNQYDYLTDAFSVGSQESYQAALGSYAIVQLLKDNEEDSLQTVLALANRVSCHNIVQFSLCNSQFPPLNTRTGDLQ